jgi:hypothetical protein
VEHVEPERAGLVGYSAFFVALPEAAFFAAFFAPAFFTTFFVSVGAVSPFLGFAAAFLRVFLGERLFWTFYTHWPGRTSSHGHQNHQLKAVNRPAQLSLNSLIAAK